MKCKRVGHRNMVAIGVVIAVGFLAAEPLWAQDAPCSKCGPGPDWIDSCAAGQDLVADHRVVAGIDLDPGGDCPSPFSTLVPCPAPDNFLVVDRSNPLDDSANFPGLRPVDGDFDVIDTEIVSMCLTNTDQTIFYRAGAGTGQGPLGANLLASFGAIAEAAGDPLTGESFFEVFFEIEVVMGMSTTYLYNQDPLQVSTNILCVPPATTYDAFIPGGCLALWNDPTPGQGIWIADASSGAQHTLFCGDGVVTPPEQCDPGNPPGIPADDLACPGLCQPDCTCPPSPFCGDGIVNQPIEECDPPGILCPDGQACRADCTCPPPPTACENTCSLGETACNDACVNVGDPCLTPSDAEGVCTEFSCEFGGTCCTCSPPIPTVSEWGLVVMTLIGLAVGTVFLWRRGANRQVEGA